MTVAFGGWVLEHHAVAAWARVQPYAQALVRSAMEVGMTVVVPAALTLDALTFFPDICLP